MQTIDFEIEGDYIELFKLLKASGVCSTGGEAKMLIDEGEVMVNGETETRKGKKIIPEDRVTLFDVEITVL
ncbi:MAG TPA: RNA-binding S4 domain-containing protein [candidate division Zixibacteria bacterium]|nr:RNA-binding S4 domain-containing protein [candidate division Zixibacteria bacterium]